MESRKKYIAIAAVAIGLGLAAYWFTNKKQRQKVFVFRHAQSTINRDFAAAREVHAHDSPACN